MKASIRRYDPADEFFISERCHIRELSNSGDDPEVSIARARVEPGVTTRWHRLRDTVERYCILGGTGLVEIGELAPQTVGPGDVVLIPPLCRQRITGTGTEDLVFLAICTPRFTDAAYEDLEA
jgi:mannose-6-phosphate isomerase-like protein (cupin superfamily)